MREFELEHDDVRMNGNVIDVFLDAFGAYRNRGIKVLARHLHVAENELGPGRDYSCRDVLDAFCELQEQFGPGFMHRIGQYMYERAAVPPGLSTFAAVLEAADETYQMNHTNGEGKIGHYHWTPDGPSSGRMVCDNPYPCAFDMGIFVGHGKQLGVDVTVIHEKEDECRHTGANQCTYRIEW